MLSFYLLPTYFLARLRDLTAGYPKDAYSSYYLGWLGQELRDGAGLIGMLPPPSYWGEGERGAIL